MLSGERDVSDILCGGAGWGRLPCTGQAVTAGFYSFTSSPYFGLSSDTGIVRMSGDREIGDRRENRSQEGWAVFKPGTYYIVQ